MLSSIFVRAVFSCLKWNSPCSRCAAPSEDVCHSAYVCLFARGVEMCPCVFLVFPFPAVQHSCRLYCWAAWLPGHVLHLIVLEPGGQCTLFMCSTLVNCFDAHYVCIYTLFLLGRARPSALRVSCGHGDCCCCCCRRRVIMIFQD